MKEFKRKCKLVNGKGSAKVKITGKVGGVQKTVDEEEDADGDADVEMLG